ncbi:MAG: hypothetical protein J1F16_10630, partial [Muribaculaceae bacterium]|nr:hypothetical protein [Muribaculaceae bacterium]
WRSKRSSTALDEPEKQVKVAGFTAEWNAGTPGTCGGCHGGKCNVAVKTVCDSDSTATGAPRGTRVAHKGRWQRRRCNLCSGNRSGHNP